VCAVRSGIHPKSAGDSPVRVRQFLRHALDHARDPRRNLRQLSPFFTGKRSCSTRPAAWSGSPEVRNQSELIPWRPTPPSARAAEEVARQLADPRPRGARPTQTARSRTRQLDAIRQTHSAWSASHPSSSRRVSPRRQKSRTLQLARADVERSVRTTALEAELAELLIPPIRRRSRCDRGNPRGTAAMKRRCSRQTSSGCTRASASAAAGKSRSSRSLPARSVAQGSRLRARGPKAYGILRYESGVHRVQRVPVTEQQGASTPRRRRSPSFLSGRIDLKIETKICASVFRSGVRWPERQHHRQRGSVTHLPTGLEVKCQDQKSQLRQS